MRILIRMGTNWDFWAGVILTGGLTLFAPAIVYGLFMLQAYRKFHLSIPFALLGLIIGISAFWVTDYVTPVVWGMSVILLASLSRHIRLNSAFIIGCMVILIPILGLTVWQFLFQGVLRPYGLMPNASSLGLAMFALMQTRPVLAELTAVTMGLSGSRTYLLLAGLVALSLRDRKRIYTVIFATVIMLSVFAYSGMLSRFLPVGFIQSWDQRVKEYTPAQIPQHPKATEPKRPEILEYTLWQSLRANPFGLGYREYNHATGRINPHNQFVLMFWELGWLAVPFLLILGCLIRQSPIPWYVWLSLTPALILTDEFYARPEGVYTLAIFTIGVRQHLKSVGKLIE